MAPFYGDGHLAVAGVHDEVVAAGEQLHGLRWTSVQAPSFGDVYLLYVPSKDPVDWTLPYSVTILDVVDLDGAAGEKYITDHLSAHGYHWLSDPGGPSVWPPIDGV